MEIFTASFENKSVIVEWEVEIQRDQRPEIFNILVTDKTTKQSNDVNLEDLGVDTRALMRSVMDFVMEQ